MVRKGGNKTLAGLQEAPSYVWPTFMCLARIHGAGAWFECHLVLCGSYPRPKVSARPGERFPLLLFSHSYGKSGQQALSEFFLEGLVDLKKFIVAAPNGREDDLGYPHWLATDGFTGHYVNVLNPKTQQMEEAPAPDFQHNASTKARPRTHPCLF